MDFTMVRQVPGILAIFDLDGTLFRSESVTVAAVQSVFRDYGLSEPSQSDICAYFGKPHADFHNWLKTISPPDESSGIIREIDHREIANITTHGILYDDVLEVLDQLLSRGMELALCTNGEEVYVTAVVDGHGLRSRFHRIRYRKSPADSKTTMVKELIEDINFRYGFMIGDRIDDMVAAKHNGLFAIGAAYGFGSPAELIGADRVLEDITSLPGILDRWEYDYDGGKAEST